MVFELTADNRRLAADMFEALSEDQWTVPSLCAEWTVRDIAAHLVMPFEVSFARFLLALVRERGNGDRVADKATRELAHRSTTELVDLLRRNADRRFSPPGVGPGGQLTDTCVHLRDAARPLGLEVSPPLRAWRLALDHIVGPKGRYGFAPRSRIADLAFVATDQDWRHGAGPEVVGTSEALAMAATGRTAALDDLTGDGAEILGYRLRPA